MSELEQRTKGEVTVVLVNHQGGAYLPRCVEAVLRQQAIREVIVVDNASSDGSPEWAEAQGGKVRVLRAGDNLGPAAARNLGLEEVTTPWVLFLDNDVYLPDDAVARLLEAGEQAPEAALVQPRSVFAGDASRVHYDGGQLHHLGL